MARPSNFSEEIAAQVCAEIATSSRSLADICAEHEEFPVPSTIYLWLSRNKEFSEQYARAKQDQAQLLADEILTIADTTQEGVIITEKPDGIEVKRADMIEHRKLRIDSRKWLASKLLPKKYGDRTQVVGDGDGPIRVVVDVVRPERGNKD